jgi:hypothetical protein
MLSLLYPHGWTPQGLSGLLWWIDAYKGITKDGSDRVSAWNDQSGNGFNLIQATGALQPLYLATGMNGLPCVECTDEGMLASFSHTGLNLAIFIVATLINAGAVGSHQVCFAQGGGSNASGNANGWVALRRNASAEGIRGHYNATNYGDQAVTYTVPYLFFNQRDGTNVGTGLNGSTPGTTALATATNFSFAAIGANITTLGTFGTGYAHLRLSEIILLSFIPDTNLRAKINGYLAWKWGNQGQLVAGHSWAQRAP